MLDSQTLAEIRKDIDRARALTVDYERQQDVLAALRADVVFLLETVERLQAAPPHRQPGPTTLAVVCPRCHDDVWDALAEKVYQRHQPIPSRVGFLCPGCEATLEFVVSWELADATVDLVRPAAHHKAVP